MPADGKAAEFVSVALGDSLAELLELWTRIGYSCEEQLHQRTYLVDAIRKVCEAKLAEERKIAAAFEAYEDRLVTSLRAHAAGAGVPPQSADAHVERIRMQHASLAKRILMLEELCESPQALADSTTHGRVSAKPSECKEPTSLEAQMLHSASTSSFEDRARSPTSAADEKLASASASPEQAPDATSPVEEHRVDPKSATGNAVAAEVLSSDGAVPRSSEEVDKTAASGDVEVSDGLEDASASAGTGTGTDGKADVSANVGVDADVSTDVDVGASTGPGAVAIAGESAESDKSEPAVEPSSPRDVFRRLREEGYQLLEDMEMLKSEHRADIIITDSQEPVTFDQEMMSVVTDRVKNLKIEHSARAEHLHSIGDEILELWDDLAVPSAQRLEFSASVTSLGRATLKVGEHELMRLKKRWQREKAQTKGKLRQLFHTARLSEQRRDCLIVLLDSADSDSTTLTTLKQELASLEQQMAQNRFLLTAIKERDQLVGFRDQMMAHQLDPNFLKLASKSELRETQLKEKKVSTDLPLLTRDLRKKLTIWEREQSLEFTVKGVRYLSKLEEQEANWRAHLEKLNDKKQSKARRSVGTGRRPGRQAGRQSRSLPPRSVNATTIKSRFVSTLDFEDGS